MHKSRVFWFKHHLFNQIYILINYITIKKTFFSLIKYANGSMAYIIPSAGLFINDFSLASTLPRLFWRKCYIGVTTLLYFIDKLAIVNNLCIKYKNLYARSNGTFCQILNKNKDYNYAVIRLPSNQEKYVSLFNTATVGRVANVLCNRSFFTKATNLKLNNKKSKVRGVAKNPVDHPHGGRTKTNQPEKSP